MIIDHRKTLKQMWNEWAEINHSAHSEYYDIEQFLEGELALDLIERQGLGDISGKRVLHAQCHFGLTTMSLSRLGANVTGIDFSDTAIDLAKALAKRAGINCRFINSDIYDLGDKDLGLFDLIFTSYGVLCWLKDMGEWASILADHLKPGGAFFIAEEHPVANMFEDAEDGSGIIMARPYFNDPVPMVFDVEGSYTDPMAHVSVPQGYAWAHSMSEIIGALLSAGLVVTEFKEYRHCAWPKYRSMTKKGRNHWRVDGNGDTLPLMFSVKALKPNDPAE
jgi:SAM-dependent methyltransferase